METTVVKVPDFHVVGLTIKGNLKEIEEQGLAKKAYKELLDRSNEISEKTDNEIYMIQIYPMNPNFNAMTDAFTQIIGYKVSTMDEVPEGMVGHTVSAPQFVKVTHEGPESDLGPTYDFVYNNWLRQSDYLSAGFDFELWDERYKPEEPDNEIDLYVAIK